jgi:hypothetical protein
VLGDSTAEMGNFLKYLGCHYLRKAPSKLVFGIVVKIVFLKSF